MPESGGDGGGRRAGGGLGPEEGHEEGESDSEDETREPVSYRSTFAISASAEGPYVPTAVPEDGAYDLYLWLLCGERGVFFLEADFRVTGDELVESSFSPDDPNTLITGTGHFALSIADCPTGPTRLGRIHLIGGGQGAQVVLDDPPDAAGVSGCGGNDDDTYSCLGFSSDGDPPPVLHPEEGCMEIESGGER